MDIVAEIDLYPYVMAVSMLSTVSKAGQLRRDDRRTLAMRESICSWFHNNGSQSYSTCAK
jgi:hypothetical protein